ncbi:molybdopterin-dependent oxidoreductase [Evansella cellulosilytica]|uniref:Oxidoreductase molybdopterin binding protein n=1 Tax=Evansella cellulosilytica (strain ATCC 21833 / DSM 2522 / FERM P-1141 / JCM 9156 / N-4) TaxID=649639 RepID=E6TTG6_EVAC2|nr:molybdopterin-dependent oxidoreductase [Evansella cellulosilytica]ADU29602.1 oxidoreductase molybdopterin binding protein [Evansella cellulosilytica DSM 2522]
MIRLKWIHHIHGVLFVLLLLSGLFLYFPTTRTWFNELRFPLVPFHIWTSILYATVILFSLRSVFKYVKNKPYIKFYNVGFNVTFIFIWIVTGVVMYFHTYFPPEMTNIAVYLHGLFTFLFIPWLLVHTIGHLFKLHLPWPKWWKRKAPVPESIAENKLNRRDFIKFTSLGVLFLFIGGAIKWFQPILNITDPNARRGYFRIYNVTSDYPTYEDTEWTFTVSGLVNNQKTFTMEDMQQLPTHTIVDDFHCVTGWSVLNVEMKGVLVNDIFTEYNISPEGPYVTAYSGDKVYYDTFTVSQLLDEGAMLVFQFDGEKLVHSQGFPCRLYHPKMYGYKSVKWIERLEFTNHRAKGYWQTWGGYDLDGYL